jgi:hypothetical protein
MKTNRRNFLQNLVTSIGGLMITKPPTIEELVERKVIKHKPEPEVKKLDFSSAITIQWPIKPMEDPPEEWKDYQPMGTFVPTEEDIKYGYSWRGHPREITDDDEDLLQGSLV